jgi:hypothetical protein
MFSEKETLIKDFENEIWLLIDGTLSEARIKYWQDKMNSLPELKNYYKQTIETLYEYDSNNQHQIDNIFFNEVIDKAVADKNNILNKLLKYFKRENIPEIRNISFASAMVIALISLLILLNKPIDQPSANKALLEWDNTSMDEKMSHVENSVYLLKNDKSIDKIIYNYTKDGWNMARSSLEEQIKILQKEINNNSF